MFPFGKRTLVLWNYAKGEVIQWIIPTPHRLTPNLLVRLFSTSRDHIFLKASSIFFHNQICLPHPNLVTCVAPTELASWKLPPLLGETTDLTRNNAITVPDPSHYRVPIAPDFVLPYAWANERISAVSMIPNSSPTPLNPVAFNVHLRNNVLLRYHLVVETSTTLDENEVVGLRLDQTSVARFPSDSFSGFVTDQFGGGVAWDASRAGAPTGKVYVYRSSSKVGGGSLSEVAEDVEMLPLERPPLKCGQPLLACMVSGRILFGKHFSAENSWCIQGCADYLP